MMTTILLGAAVSTWFLVWLLRSEHSRRQCPSSWDAQVRYVAERQRAAKAEADRLRALEDQMKHLTFGRDGPRVASEHDEVEVLRRENARLEDANRDLQAMLPTDDYRTIKRGSVP